MEDPERLRGHDRLPDHYRAAVDPLRNGRSWIPGVTSTANTGRVGPIGALAAAAIRIAVASASPPSGLNGLIDGRSLARHLKHDSSVPRDLVVLGAILFALLMVVLTFLFRANERESRG